MRSRVATAAVVLAAASAMALSGCASSGGKKTSSPTGTPTGSSSSAGGGGGLGGGGGKTYTIGFQGPLSGSNAQLGINELNGVELAITEANKSGNLGFKVVLDKQDDQGNQSTASTPANSLVASAAVGVIGPSFSGPTQTAGPIFNSAGLTFITPSATKATLQTNNWKTFHRVVPNDNVEGTQGADWLARKGIKKLFVLQDQSPYGQGVGDTVAKEARAKGVTVTEQGLDGTTTSNYNPIASTIKNSGAQAVFYGGYDAQAALLAKALNAVNFTGLKVTGNGGKSSIFTKNAGSAGNGWYFTCGCQDATVAPQSKTFAAAYQAMFKTPPSTYSPEAFDATNALIAAIKAAAAKGSVTRASVLAAVDAVDYKGITTTVKFQSDGELDTSVQTVNLYVEKNGQIVSVGNIKDQK